MTLTRRPVRILLSAISIVVLMLAVPLALGTACLPEELYVFQLMMRQAPERSRLVFASGAAHAATLDARISTQDPRGFGSGFVPAPIRPQYFLTQVVDTAERNYPSLRRVYSQVTARDAGISLAKTAYLPTLDIIVQETRGTQNVIAGTIFPQVLDAIPIQSGTPTHSSTFKSYWNSNQAANMSWEIWDFGLRHANVQKARAMRTQSVAKLKLTELDVGAKASEVYLKAVAAYETIRARQAVLKRMEAWQLVTKTLVDNGLRPGVDASRADADVSEAKIALLEAEREYEVARVDLAETMGMAGNSIAIVTAPYITQPQQEFPPLRVNLKEHPMALLRGSAVKTEAAKVHVLDRTYYPHLWYHSAMWGRGNGLPSDPRVVAGGILPQTANWTVGLSMSFPMFDYWKVKAERRMASRVEDASRSNYDVAMQQIIKGDERAKVLLDYAKRIANETPILVKAARDTEMRAVERYKVGLTDIVDVAQAERILARAEVENAVADVRVWRALLALSYAQGNLRPFLQLAAMAEAKNR